MKAYKIIKSNIHRKGLCAARNIKKGERIIEYKGKKITHKQADEDAKYGYDITYLFTLNKKLDTEDIAKIGDAAIVKLTCLNTEEFHAALKKSKTHTDVLLDLK